MDINATLIGQMITFAVFVIFTMKFVWPPITKALQDREKKIADGLAAAEKGELSLQHATDKAKEIIQEAKITSAQIVEQAHVRTGHLIEEAKEIAKQESDRIIAHAQSEVAQQFNQARTQLQNQVADMALKIAEKIVQHDLDANAHRELLEKMVAEI
jgi:F-type H+-transporting ATPase subunit b